MTEKINIKTLEGKDLSEFKIVAMQEVFRVNDDGIKTQSIGFFRSFIVAIAFIDSQADANRRRIAPAFVLTDGKIGFVLDKTTPITLFDDEQEALEIKKKAVAKLTPAERELLGLDE